MSGKEVSLDALRLTSLNPLYGKEDQYDFDGGQHTLQATLYAADDLILTRNVELLFTFTNDYLLNGGMEVSTSSPEAFAETICHVEGSRELRIDWLASAKVPVSVWFFAIRNALKTPGRPSWYTPLEVKSCFQATAMCLGGGNLQQVSLVCGAGRSRGRRPYMEDVDFVFDDIRVSDRQASAQSTSHSFCLYIHVSMYPFMCPFTDLCIDSPSYLPTMISLHIS